MNERPQEPALRVEAVHKRYGEVRALSDVDLEVAEGEVVALLGPNGAGKTTLVSIVAGLRRPDEGRVRVWGVDVLTRPHEARQKLGLAPQETGIYPTVSVESNLRFFGELVGLRRKALDERVEQVVGAFDLSHLLRRRAHDLSGGEARRLHTAMAVMHRPPLLLLDEPTAGGDVQSRGMLLEVVKSLAEEGAAVCYSTHYLSEVEQLGASVAILDRGRIVARGPLPALVRAHGQSAVELHFKRAPPLLEGGRTSQVVGQTLRIATEGPPASELATILGGLGAATQDLQQVKLIQPSLESVFLSVTGRHLAEAEEPTRGTDHP